MTRSLSFAFLFLSVGACTTDSTTGTTPGTDELAGENSDDGTKADGNALQDTFGIYTATKVGAFECNGLGSCTHVDLVRANFSTTTCADGSKAASCSVRYLDFSKLGLSATKLSDTMAKLQASAATPDVGVQLLVRGTYVHGTNALYPHTDWVTFQVTELWVAQLADGTVDGTFVMLRNNGRECFDSACEAINEARLNSARQMDTDGIDWPKDLENTETQTEIEAAWEVADGLIVTGDRTNGTFMHQKTILRTPDQVYLRVK